MNELSERLAEIAETPGPDGSVDAPAAIAKGRRVRRRRRWTAALAAAGITAAVAVPIAQAARPDAPDRTPVVTPSTARAMLVEPATFGWLPEGYARTSASVGIAGRDEIFTMAAGREPDGAGVTLTVFPPGREPDVQDPARGEPFTAAEPVDGRPADWIAEPGAGLPPKLRFRYRADAWATLQVNDRPLMDARTVRRIAESVEFGGGRPLRFPVGVAGVPEGLRVLSAGVGARASVGFTWRDDRDGMLEISLEPTHPRARDRENTTIDGHAAYDSRLPDVEPKPIVRGEGAGSSYHLVIYGVQGFDVTLGAQGDRLVRQLEKTGGLTGLYQRITFLGPDESKWTTTPLG